MVFQSRNNRVKSLLIGHHLMLMGDFHDFLNPMVTNYSHLQLMCIVHGLSNHVQSPTRLGPTSARCIELILGNFPELSQPMVDHVDFTDHALISGSLNTTVEKKHQTMETTRRTWPSMEKLSSATSDFQHVLQFYMQTLPTAVDVDKWEEWKQRFHAALDEVAPRVTKVHSHKRCHCPWMTKELLNLIQKQKSFHRRLVKSANKNSELITRHRALHSKTNNLYRRGTPISKTGCCSTVRHLVKCGLQSNTSQISNAFLCKFQSHSTIYLVRWAFITTARTVHYSLLWSQQYKLAPNICASHPYRNWSSSFTVKPQEIP